MFQVAKGASHMVLADDSFSTIVSVVGEVKIYLQQHQSFHKVCALSVCLICLIIVDTL